jgi:hypothetical protein
MLRRSELALFVRGLMKELDISPDIGKAEAAADSAATALGEKLMASVNKYVNKLEAALGDRDGNVANP